MNKFKIKELRKKMNLTVQELSIKSGVAMSYVSTLENDKSGLTNPTMEIMIKISNALGCSPNEVFF
ncbi:XRE family transcriptional regulator [Clostridium beijerinckii]|nr:XRE family transcriptional regulator [Clostridium beijerinckii]